MAERPTTIEQEVLTTVASKGPVAPTVVAETLAEKGREEPTVRSAVWSLIGRGELEVTDDWRLTTTGSVGTTK
ncbi:MAG: hypothetical protein JST54_26610 [Deltaproteobacteria bacterium]|nr:hypothetical protein [Deltaproteobacteria bacterium]